MDAFESLVAKLLQQRGYWTWQSYKVEITKEEKRSLGKPSMPRPEIDVLAYKPGENRLLWVECKSYLDSPGVSIEPFTEPDSKWADRYRVFTNDLYREIVSQRLIQQIPRKVCCYRTYRYSIV
jgi:hypothetical protein